MANIEEWIHECLSALGDIFDSRFVEKSLKCSHSRDS